MSRLNHNDGSYSDSEWLYVKHEMFPHRRIWGFRTLRIADESIRTQRWDIQDVITWAIRAIAILGIILVLAAIVIIWRMA